jgi:uncharacterized flavoprotein (TIGR03862 family)
MTEKPAVPHSVAVIGGGPAGLMAAEVLSKSGIQVNLYDAMPSVGRKFLIAGKGGLNLTHSEPYDEFLSHYGSQLPRLKPMLDQFGPKEIVDWVSGLGIETFVGSSDRVFPATMNAGPLLHAWVKRLRADGVIFHTRHKWIGWTNDRSFLMESPEGQINITSDAVILALGGGSWKKLGSTGEWVKFLSEQGVDIAPLKPSNCGFDVAWSEHFRSRFEGQPLKSVVLTFIDSKGNSFNKPGEFVVTIHGVEGSLIYSLSPFLRDEIELAGKAIIKLDLAPGIPVQRLVEKLAAPRGKQSIANHLRKTVNISGVKAGLLWEFVPREQFNDPERLATMIKGLPIPLLAARPLDEAISSAGGVRFTELDERLMIRSMPGIFCAGEMLDWEAPTGGYLISACLATGRAAAFGVMEWLGTSH